MKIFYFIYVYLYCSCLYLFCLRPELKDEGEYEGYIFLCLRSLIHNRTVLMVAA